MTVDRVVRGEDTDEKLGRFAEATTDALMARMLETLTRRR